MKVKLVETRVLTVAIMLLSLAWLGQPALADDDDDECPPLIKAVNIDFSEKGNSISIFGECFGNEDLPKVTLCGDKLPVKHNSETTIDSNLSHVPATDDCVLTVCIDDDGGTCDRFWIGALPYGPESQLPSRGSDGAKGLDGVGIWTTPTDWARCWKSCNPGTKPRPIEYCGRKYEWVCLCDEGCCHWAPPILPICRETRPRR